MRTSIRAFTPEDYDALAAVGNAAEPEYPWTPQEWRENDAHRHPSTTWGRLVAVAEDGVVGAVGYSQHRDAEGAPARFHVRVLVHPDYQGRGVGAALYDACLREMAAHRPVQLSASARESEPRAVKFCLDRGFREGMREWESRLDVAAYDPAAFEADAERVRRQGIEVRSVAELRGDPDRDRKLHALVMEIDADVPSVHPFTPLDFDYWVEHRLNRPNRLHEGSFVAVDGGDYVGYTSLSTWSLPGVLDTGITGVRRSHRRRGIAMAVKLRALEYAKRTGAREVRTWNATTNQGMLAINIRLGFQRQPAWIELVKDLPLPGDER